MLTRVQIAGEKVRNVDRVLDVRQGELCWVVGTVYMDMPLKPSILDDISKDHWIAAPPPREKYVSPSGEDKAMLEDESGRLRLLGTPLQSEILVTGCIIAVMGTENAEGNFEVIDIKIPDLAPQPARWHFDSTLAEKPSSGKLAIVSGLDITGDSGETLPLDLLQEFLIGESASPSLQAQAASITRLLIVGNSLAEASPIDRHDDNPTAKKSLTAKKYGYDSAAYNPLPSNQLDSLIASIVPSLPITLIPGASDPANVAIPQQPLHAALFPQSRAYAAPPIPKSGPISKPSKPEKSKPTPADAFPFHPATNPAYLSLNGHLLLATAGQTIHDIEKYLAPHAYDSPIDLLEATLRWRNIAPTAPDTLWCYPYQTGDPFVIRDGMCPHLYVVGSQPRFETRVVEGAAGARVRCVCVPRFSRTGEVVLVDLATLECELVRLRVEDAV